MARKRLILLDVLCLLLLQAYLVAEVKELQDGALAKSQTASQVPADLSLQTNPNAPGPLVISTLDDGTSVIGHGEVDFADGPALNPNLLAATEVDAIVQAAVQAVDRDGFSVVITDRSGRILAAWETPGSTLEHGEWALSLARTGAFFSNDQAPLSSRTVRFISGIHFPPGIPFQPNGALYGIESSNRGCSLNAEFNSGKFLPPAKSLQSFLRETGITEGSPRSCDALDVGGCGVGVTTGKYGGIFEDGRLSEVAVEEILGQNPSQVHGGGFPIFRPLEASGNEANCERVGGIGVFGIPPREAEYAALVGVLKSGFGPLPCVPSPGAIFWMGFDFPSSSRCLSLQGHNLAL